MSYDYHATDDLSRIVIRVLQAHVGRAHAIPRVVLMAEVRRQFGPARAMGGSTLDRRVRDALAQAAIRPGPGALVCSGAAGEGYWLAETAAEVVAHLAKEESRLASIAIRVRAQRRAAKATFARLAGQPVRQMALDLADE